MAGAGGLPGREALLLQPALQGPRGPSDSPLESQEDWLLLRCGPGVPLCANLTSSATSSTTSTSSIHAAPAKDGVGSGSAARRGPRADQASVLPCTSAARSLPAAGGDCSGGSSSSPSKSPSRVARLLEEAFGPRSGVGDELATIPEGDEVGDDGSLPMTGLGPVARPLGHDELDIVTPCAPLCVPGAAAPLEPALPPVACFD